MIAARFRLVGWVAGCAGAALICYMASQSVAAERSALLKVDGQIADTKSDIARLDTEITARSRAGQVENWNSVMELKAARPGQYVQTGFQLASLAGERRLPLDPQTTSLSAVQAAAYQAPAATPAPAQPAVAAAAEAPAQPTLRAATLVRPQASPLDSAAPALIHASYVKESAVPAAAPPPLVIAKVEKPKADPVKPKVAKADDKPKAKSAADAAKLKVAKAEDKPAAKPKADKPALKLADADVPKAKPKKAHIDDGFLPDDIGKLIAAEKKAKPHKAAL